MKKIMILVVLALCLCGCTAKENSSKKQDVSEISWYMMKDEAIADANVSAFNKLLRKKGYNLSVKFQYIDSDITGEEPSKYHTSLEKEIKDQKVDLANLGWEFSVYPGLCAEFVRKEYCYSLDDWLGTKEGKKIADLYDEEIWDSCRVDGKVVAFPNERINASVSTVVSFNDKYVPQKLSEKWDGTWNGLYNILDNIKLPKGVYPIKGYPTIDGFTGMEGMSRYVIQDDMVYDKETKTFQSLFDVQQFHDYCKFLHQCVKKGYLFDVEMGTFLYDNDIYQSMEDGNYVVALFNDTADQDQVTTYSADIFSVQNTLGTQTMVAKNSRHRDEAVQLMAALRSDDELAQTLLYGTIGIDSVKEGQETIDGEWSLGLADGVLPSFTTDDETFRQYKQNLMTSDKREKSGIVGFYPNYVTLREDMEQYINLLQKYENCWLDDDFEQNYQKAQKKIRTASKSLFTGVNEQLQNWFDNKEK